MRARPLRAPDQLLPVVTAGTLLLLACSASVAPADAQVTTVRIDVGASRVRYADTLRTTAVAFTPEIIAEWPLAVFRAATSVARLSGGGTSVQGTGALSLYTPSYGPLLGELEVYGGGSRNAGINTSQVLAVARGHVGRGSAGAWVGGGAGTASNGGERRPSRMGEVGAWAGRGAARASLVVAPTVVEDTVRYTDINLTATAVTRRLELTAAAGSRSGTQPTIFGSAVKAWASASLVSWLGERFALIAGAGRYPVDLTQGFPGGTYWSVGLRVATRFGTPEEPPAPPRTRPLLPADAPVSEMQVSGTGTRRLIFFRAPAAQKVEIAGDFSGWRPLEMTQRLDGWWSIELDLAPGRYETSIRLDGGPWQAPPGLLLIRDEFGGEGGLLVIP